MKFKVILAALLCLASVARLQAQDLRVERERYEEAVNIMAACRLLLKENQMDEFRALCTRASWIVRQYDQRERREHLDDARHYLEGVRRDLR